MEFVEPIRDRKKIEVWRELWSIDMKSTGIKRVIGEGGFVIPSPFRSILNIKSKDRYIRNKNRKRKSHLKKTWICKWLSARKLFV